MDADKILEKLGKFGRFQILLFLSLSFVYMRGAWPVLAILFLGGDPGHHCKISPNSTLNSSIPLDKDGEYETCSMYVPGQRNKTQVCTDGWTYGDEFDTTILSDWDLVCSKDYLVDLSTTIYMVGNTLGAILLTPLSDRFGRKPVILIMLWIQAAIGFGTAFANSYTLFTVLRFFIGLLNMPIALSTYVMITEMFPSSHRSYPSVGINCSWGVGLIVLSVFGYYIRDWRILQMVISLPNLLTVIYYWFLPESLPWLIANKKYKKAKTVAKWMAKINGKQLPENLFEEHPSEEEAHGQPIHSQEGLTRPGEVRGKKYTILDLFKTPKIRRYTFVMLYLWFADSLSYFGILFATPQLHGNQFLNLGISGAVEIPALIICMFAIDFFGRRKSMVAFLLLCGVTNIVIIFIPAQTDSGVDLGPLQITLAMIGKFGITGAYSITYLYSTEIYPTVIRNHAVGLSSFCENLGGIVSPLIVYGTTSLTNVPLVIFGVITLLGGILAFLLPETHKRPLPETIEEVENYKYSVAIQTEDTHM